MEEGKEEQDVESKPIESGLSWEPLLKLQEAGTWSPPPGFPVRVLLRL